MCPSDDWPSSGRFSNLYVEADALDHPVAKRVVSRCQDARVVLIDSYKSLFNRPRQDPNWQRRNQKLILARKRPPFLYELSEKCQTSGVAPSCYTTPVINCLFNCDYCYLHGMTNTANIVVFVNVEDFFGAAKGAAKALPPAGPPLQLNLSYDTDLLAFERLTGFVRAWMAFTRETPGILAELRTKSGGYALIRDVTPIDRFILAWSLTPDEVGRRYEHGAPPLRSRLRAAAQAVQEGWAIRLSFDPIIPIEGWQPIYERFFEEVFETVPREGIREVAAGLFRMGKTHYRRIRRWRPKCDLYHLDFGRHRAEVETTVYEQLCRYVERERIEIWKQRS